MIAPEVEELLRHLYVRQVEGEAAAPLPDPSAVEAARAGGFIESAGDDWRLTPAGERAARDVVRRHRLAERLLRDVLAVSGEQVDAGACRFEHILLEGLDEKVCVLLGHPAACPHGRPIPPGPCCRLARQREPQVRPLSQARPGDEGVVAYLQASDQEEVRKLLSIGVLPGVGIVLRRRFPSFVFQVGFSQFTVDRNLAEKIFVRWKAPPPVPPEGGPHRHRRGRGGR